ncbi:hypothetical protein CSB11_02945 [Candidatus Campbellbacteria bacterium]|nr:MAG: hypothetical protein CSB11_02945 [Candidatus Campbellbacteria bacterium]
MDYKTKYPEETWLESIYQKNDKLTKEDKKLIEKAYFYAEKAHIEQKRKSGEPYFIHLVETAKILADLQMDGTVIAAGLLHDSVEDGVATQKDIKENFGDEILFLINGVTKLGHLKYKGLRRHNESLRKLFVATSKDTRVLIIKFADRIHNLKTLQHVRPDKQERIAKESLEIYTPLAYRLGITKLSKELGDLAFPYAYPDEYKKVNKVLKERSKENMKNLEKASRSISRKLAENKIKNFKITHRVKALVSLHKKLLRKKWEDNKIYDIIAMRILVNSIEDCYKVLGIVHQTFQPMPGRLKDYIAVPKPNGYQSIHTTVFTGQGGIIEIQIRTYKMHQEAEYGAASHLGYKAETVGVEGVTNTKKDWVTKFAEMFGKKKPQNIKNQKTNPKWIKDLAKSADEPEKENFKDDLASDFFSDRIFVFTPKGEVIDLPEGSCPIDFAYQVHTKVGEKTTGAKINGKFSALNTILKNGDIVEIETKKNAKPNLKWLEFVKTTTAKKRIRAFCEKNKK